jgi:DNA repair protein RadC
MDPTEPDGAIERPRERLRTSGIEALSHHELIALVLGTGTWGASAERVAAELLSAVGGLATLARASPLEMIQTPGIGEARAGRLAAAFELGRRALIDPPRDERLVSPADVAARLRPLMHGVMQEIFVVLALDTRLRLIDQVEVARGVLDGVVVHPREVFRPLIRRGAAAAVLAHNHPSGDPTPSPEDVAMTHRLRAVGELCGIPIVDHVVLGGDRFVSIAERCGGLEPG